MALALIVGPFVVAQVAIDGKQHTFLDEAFDTVSNVAPAHDGEPLGVFHPFAVGVLVTLVDGDAERRLLAVVVEVSDLRL